MFDVAIDRLVLPGRVEVGRALVGLLGALALVLALTAMRAALDGTGTPIGQRGSGRAFGGQHPDGSSRSDLRCSWPR